MKDATYFSSYNGPNVYAKFWAVIKMLCENGENTSFSFSFFLTSTK